MSGFETPNYTQVPNVFLDDMISEMGEAELRVALVIMRETFGWHRESKQMSLSYLQQATGMSRPGVISGINSGIERGVFERTPNGSSYTYTLVIAPNDTESASKRSLPEVVNEVDYIQIKSKERSKESGSSAAANPSAEKDDNYHHFVKAMETAWGMGPSSPYDAERIEQWMNEIPLNAWEYALRQAAEAGPRARNWRYLTSILNRVAVDGIPAANQPKRSFVFGEPKREPREVVAAWMD
ncbi:MAG: hypothetical protein R2854_20380 [Caldilineaceae bacterium]